MDQVLTLSPRLNVVASLVPADRPMADIGTDHAFLPVYLVATGRVPEAIAADRLPGPLEAARSTVARAGLEDRVLLRQGDGLTVLHPGEVHTVAICGMGGPLIESILDAGPLQGVERLVLQPMGGEEQLRAWLTGAGWRLVAEQLVEDAGRIYLVLCAERGAMSLSPAEEISGPCLLRRGDPLLVRYLSDLLCQSRRAQTGARRSVRPDAVERAEILSRRIRLLEEVIARVSRNPR